MPSATLQQRRAELECQKASVDARLKDVESVEKAVSDKSNLERELSDAKAAVTSTSEKAGKAQRFLDHATMTARLAELTEKQITADRLAETHERAQGREQKALGNV